MKNILITGCSSGFGYHAAKYLAEKGHHVYATMRNVTGKNAEPAQQLLDFGKEHGYAIDVVEMDVTSDESVTTAVEGIETLDVLINMRAVDLADRLNHFLQMKYWLSSI